MTELQQRYESETGQSAIECIDVSKIEHRVLTRASERFLEWADRFVKKEGTDEYPTKQEAIDAWNRRA